MDKIHVKRLKTSAITYLEKLENNFHKDKLFHEDIFFDVDDLDENRLNQQNWEIICSLEALDRFFQSVCFKRSGINESDFKAVTSTLKLDSAVLSESFFKLTKLIVFYWRYRLNEANKIANHAFLKAWFEEVATAEKLNIKCIIDFNERLSDKDIQCIKNLVAGDINNQTSWDLFDNKNSLVKKYLDPKTIELVNLIKQIKDPGAFCSISFNEKIRRLYELSGKPLWHSLDQYFSRSGYIDQYSEQDLPDAEAYWLRNLPELKKAVHDKYQYFEAERQSMYRAQFQQLLAGDFPWRYTQLANDQYQLFQDSVNQILNNPQFYNFISCAHLSRQIIDDYALNITAASADIQLLISWLNAAPDSIESVCSNRLWRIISIKLRGQLEIALNKERKERCVAQLIHSPEDSIAFIEYFPELKQAQDLLRISATVDEIKQINEQFWRQLPLPVQDKIKSHFFALLRKDFLAREQFLFVNVWLKIPHFLANESMNSLIHLVSVCLDFNDKKIDFYRLLEKIAGREQDVLIWLAAPKDEMVSLVKRQFKIKYSEKIKDSLLQLFFLARTNKDDLFDLMDVLIATNPDLLLDLQKYVYEEEQLMVRFLFYFVAKHRLTDDDLLKICKALIAYRPTVLKRRWSDKFTSDLTNKINTTVESCLLRYLMEFAQCIDLDLDCRPKLMQEKQTIFYQVDQFLSQYDSFYNDENLIADLRKFDRFKSKLQQDSGCDAWLISNQLSPKNKSLYDEFSNAIELLFNYIPITRSWIKSDDFEINNFNSQGVAEILRQFTQWSKYYSDNHTELLSVAIIQKLSIWAKKIMTKLKRDKGDLERWELLIKNLADRNFEQVNEYNETEMLNKVVAIFEEKDYRIFFTEQQINAKLSLFDKYKELVGVLVDYKCVLNEKAQIDEISYDPFDRKDRSKLQALEKNNSDLENKVSAIANEIFSELNF